MRMYEGFIIVLLKGIVLVDQLKHSFSVGTLCEGKKSCMIKVRLVKKNQDLERA